MTGTDTGISTDTDTVPLYLQVNGQAYPYTPGLTLHALLRELDVERPRVAVAVGDDFYPGGQAPDCALQSGDVIEIVRAIGGG